MAKDPLITGTALRQAEQPPNKDPNDQLSNQISQIQNEAYKAGADDYANTLGTDQSTVNLRTPSATATEIQDLRDMILNEVPMLPQGPSLGETALIAGAVFAIGFLIVKGLKR